MSWALCLVVPDGRLGVKLRFHGELGLLWSELVGKVDIYRVQGGYRLMNASLRVMN